MNKENKEKNILEDSNIKCRKGQTLSNKRQLAQLRKHSVRQMQDIEVQNNVKIQTIMKQHQSQKESLIYKYESIMKEKDDYIAMLEEMFSNDSMNQTKKTNQHSHFYNTNQIVFHQSPLYEELCSSVEVRKRKLTKEKRVGSSSRHKLNPAKKPIYKMI